MVILSAADRALVSAAVTAAERGMDCEIMTIVADRSDAYHDVALHWAMLAALLMIAGTAAAPAWLQALSERMVDGWRVTPSLGRSIFLLMLAAVIAFLVTAIVLRVPAIRMILTPKPTRAVRVRRRALMLFRVAIESRTAARNGVLLYLSLAERRAEIVVDAAIHAAIPVERWGDMMAELLVAVRAGQPGEGMAAAVAAIGRELEVLFSRSGRDPQELPDRLIQL